MPRLQPSRICRGIAVIAGVVLVLQFYQLTIFIASNQVHESKDPQVLQVIANASSAVNTSTTITTPQPVSNAVLKPTSPSVISCGGRYPSEELLGADVDWKAIHLGYFVYSAFFDARVLPRALRITAVVPKLKAHPEIFAYVWYPGASKPFKQTGRILGIGEAMNYRWVLNICLWYRCYRPLIGLKFQRDK
jgi:hypothetical protein